MIRRSEGQTEKILALEQAEENFLRFLEEYNPEEEDPEESLLTDEELEAIIRSFETPHEADHVFDWLTGEYENVRRV
jgi:hypothetical protein